MRHTLAPLLQQKAIEGGEDPAPLLGISALFGELGWDGRPAAPVGRWPAMLYRRGSRAAMTEALRAVDAGAAK